MTTFKLLRVFEKNKDMFSDSMFRSLPIDLDYFTSLTYTHANVQVYQTEG